MDTGIMERSINTAVETTFEKLEANVTWYFGAPLPIGCERASALVPLKDSTFKIL